MKMYIEMYISEGYAMATERIWQVVEARDRLKDIIDAAVQDGPQIIRRRHEDVVVVVSVKDWRARQSTLKDWLTSGQGRTEDLLGGGGEDIVVDGTAFDA